MTSKELDQLSTEIVPLYYAWCDVHHAKGLCPDAQWHGFELEDYLIPDAMKPAAEWFITKMLKHNRSLSPQALKETLASQVNHLKEVERAEEAKKTRRCPIALFHALKEGPDTRRRTDLINGSTIDKEIHYSIVEDAQIYSSCYESIKSARDTIERLTHAAIPVPITARVAVGEYIWVWCRTKTPLENFATETMYNTPFQIFNKVNNGYLLKIAVNNG